MLSLTHSLGWSDKARPGFADNGVGGRSSVSTAAVDLGLLDLPLLLLQLVLVAGDHRGRCLLELQKPVEI